MPRRGRAASPPPRAPAARAPPPPQPRAAPPPPGTGFKLQSLLPSVANVITLNS